MRPYLFQLSKLSFWNWWARIHWRLLFCLLLSIALANVILFQEVVLHIPELGPSYPGHDLLSGRFVKFTARANVPYRAFRGRLARAVNFTKPPAAFQLMQRSPADACSRGLSLHSSLASACSKGFAALRAPHPSSPARRGGVKQIEAQRPAAFRAFSVQGLTGAGLPTALYEKSPAQSAELQFVCGERGIRTPGPVKINGFQDRRIRPLCHLSKVECYFAPCHVFREMDCKDKYFFRNRKRL